MMKTERMRDMNDPWVTEYRGQFNYAIPANQEVQSFLYDYDGNYYSHSHPSSRLPNDDIYDMPPHPTGYVSNNGQYYDETGQPYNPPPPPPPPRKRMASAKKRGSTASNTTKNGKTNNATTVKHNINNERKQKISFNNVTVPDPPKFHASKTANRHILNCADPYAPITKSTLKERGATLKHIKNPSADGVDGARLYHPLNYVNRKQAPRARVTAPVPHPPPVPPSYSPFSTQDSLSTTKQNYNNNKLYSSSQNKFASPPIVSNSKFQVHEVEPSPHGPLPSHSISFSSPSISHLPPPPPPPPLPSHSISSPSFSSSISHPLPPPPPPLPQVREATPSPRGPLPSSSSLPSHSISSHSISSPSIALPPPAKPSVAWEVPDNGDEISTAVQTIVPPPAFSRDPQDKSTIPAHTCSHRWRNDSELYWSNLPYRESPPLECAMCFARPHPTQYTKSFDPSRWLELNPKFYKYMPAQSLRKIPPAGKVVNRSPGFSISSMYNN